VAETYGIGNISLRYIGWGAEFVDFDSDGWLDLAVANGSTFETQGQPRKLVPMEPFLFWNNHGKFFFDLAPWNTSLSVAHVSRGLAVSDYDHDGAADIAVMDLDGGVRLLRNRIPQGNWIEFRLHSRTAGGILGRGEGARLIAEAGGQTFRHSVTTASYLSQSSRTVHLGLGQAPRVDALEVRWPDGSAQHFASLAPNQIWDLTQGKTEALPWNPGVGGELLSRTQSPQHNVGSKQAEIQFWSKQRAAMDAMKREGDIPRAISLFREALALNPAHEDSRYYLANCLLVRGDLWGAVRELDELARLNPSSHRAFQRKGLLLASAARSDSELSKAQESLEKAHSLNPEETGTRLLLGELSLLRGDLAGARQRFELVCRSHARSVGALYLRAYLAWKRGDRQGSEDLLKAAAAARGKDWKPKGSVMEGDVLKRMHTDATLLSRFWDEWDGTANPTRAFGALDAFVRLPVAMRRSADSSPQSDRSEPARVTAVSSRRE
ncbi:MAG TPA: ASPIC/UnbV domain-containing protein, partial [Bryobacteraceae bacterium]|nr:ASPIC/UnbV domain-containing protein [Bryobacteraceae bacterium]